jgi:hypothetical protein
MLKRTHRARTGFRSGRNRIRDHFYTGIPIIDWFVTVVTGKAHSGQKPLFELDGAILFVITLVMYALLHLGLLAALSQIDVSPGYVWVLAPLAAVLTLAVIGRLRALQVAFGHYSAHGIVSKRWPWTNQIIKIVSTVLPLAQNAVDYFVDHIKYHHKRSAFTTLSDPDARMLFGIGFRRGMTRHELYSHLAKTLLSPRFHAGFLLARLRSALVTAGPVHRTLVMAWLAVLMSASLVLPLWVWLVGVLFPMTVGLQMSSLLQFISEHKLGVPGDPVEDNVAYMERCAGRYSLLAPPEEQGWSGAIAWCRWSVGMCFELAIRLAVMPVDIPNHDAHHAVGFINAEMRDRSSSSRRNEMDWVIAAYDRQDHIDNDGDPFGMGQREFYGYFKSVEWALSVVD